MSKATTTSKSTKKASSASSKRTKCNNSVTRRKFETLDVSDSTPIVCADQVGKSKLYFVV